MTMSALLIAAMVLADTTGVPCSNLAASDPVVHALNQIELAGTDLQTLSSDVIYRKDDALLGSREIRTGTLLFERIAGTPRLAVDFKSRVVNNRRRTEAKRIVYADGWLVESDESTRQFIKRQLSPANEARNPMRLGGPFPMPLGQKRDDVTKRFEVTQIAEFSDPDILNLAGATCELIGLHLIPLDNVPEADQWRSIDIWYDTSTWIPVGVVAIELNGDTRRIRLLRSRVNPTFEDTQRSALSIVEPTDAGWSIDVRPLPPSPLESPPESPDS